MISLSGSLGPRVSLNPVVRAGRQQPIDGSCTCAANHQEGRSRQHEEVVLIALSLLCSSPVHKEAELTMNHRDGHDHVAKDSQGSNASEQSENKTQSAEKFRGNGQKCENSRN